MFIVGIDKLTLKLVLGNGKSNLVKDFINSVKSTKKLQNNSCVNNLFPSLEMMGNNDLFDFVEYEIVDNKESVETTTNVFKFKNILLVENIDNLFYIKNYRNVYNLFINGILIGILYWNCFNNIIDNNGEYIGLNINNKRLYDRFELTINYLCSFLSDYDIILNNITCLDVYVDSDIDMIERLSVYERKINNYLFKKDLNFVYFDNVRRFRNYRIKTGKGIKINQLKKNNNSTLYSVKNHIQIRLYDKTNEIKYNSNKQYIIEHHNNICLLVDKTNNIQFQRLEFSLFTKYILNNKIMNDVMNLPNLLNNEYLLSIFNNVYDKYLDIRIKNNNIPFKKLKSVNKLYV